jgi:predicted transcriptional regulator of viral defense system
MGISTMDRVIALTRRRGLLRPRDLAAHGIARQYLVMARQQGLIERLGRGLYHAPGAMISEHQSLALVCKKSPAGVVCLLSALRFHDLTTQNPTEVWLAIGQKAREPRIDTVAVRVVHFSGAAFTEGVQTHNVHGIPVRVYNIAKTVADCFKFRNKIGVNVAVEALRDCLRQRKTNIDELVRYARICRVERVMNPYLEALL